MTGHSDRRHRPGRTVRRRGQVGRPAETGTGVTAITKGITGITKITNFLRRRPLSMLICLVLLPFFPP